VRRLDVVGVPELVFMGLERGVVVHGMQPILVVANGRQRGLQERSEIGGQRGPDVGEVERGVVQ